MRVLIIDHDPQAVEHLQRLLKETAPEKKVAGHCTSVKDAVAWLQTHPLPDLVFSVVQLPDGLSFEVFKQLQVRVPVIFTCPYDKYAIDAFRAGGIFYLLKPLKKEDLQEALERYESEYRHSARQRQIQQRHQERFLVRVGQHMKLVPAEDIAYFYTEHKVVYLVTFNRAKYVIGYTLEQLEQMLNPAVFFRINRQFIIHLSAIVKMVPASKSRLQVILKPETEYNTVTSFGRTDGFYKWLVGEQ